MKKYQNFNEIKKADIQSFSGLENELLFSPIFAIDMTPLKVFRFGITNPDPNYYIKRNSSPCFILEYVVSGAGYLEINGQKHRVEENDTYIVHPGDKCEYYADSEKPYKKYWINFDCTMFFNELLNAYDVNDRIIRGVNLSAYFEKLFALEMLSDLNDELYIPISKLIFCMIMDIAEHKRKSRDVMSRDIAYSVKVILNKHVSTPITLDEIAQGFFHSKNDIIRSFKSKYGITPYSYLIELRMRKGKNLLINTNKTLSEIAEELCFSSEYHFSNTFKKKVGVSPREFRKR